MNDTFSDILNKNLKNGYFDLYGGSVFITIFFLLSFFFLMSYFYILHFKHPIKNEWDKNKCKPHVLPFAGLLFEPKNMSSFDFTKKNFSFCTNKLLNDTIKSFVDVIYSIIQ